ncbi:hypothetical protein A1O1_08816 [Capronia coronata CBS 617.96]|uniref:Uncharacterized protein n=1 Tax=Capronia coronata CBS 617.96 TaxID=1182541 RepID=W9XN96_9EURO|nr:uncharacterized protein A1O1_08816 [Capronia coronata CBS 617.96]EXJ78416.1 hypothetical protein A1O1_08816 [Capronia coronata CBS 617.96]
MAPCRSRAVLFDGVTVTEHHHRRDGASVPTTTSTNTTAGAITGNTTITTNTNAAGTYGPGNHCQGCTCPRRTVPVEDESNRETYGRQGGGGCGCGCGCGSRPIPSPEIEMHDYFKPHLSSVNTDDTYGPNGASFNNSWEVHDDLNTRLTSRNLRHHDNDSARAEHTRLEYTMSAIYDDDSDDDNNNNEHPWSHFISRGDSPEYMAPPTTAEDSSGMILTGHMDDSCGSMFVGHGQSGPNSGDLSMLSSYEASFSRGSVTASQILRGAGAAFGN